MDKAQLESLIRNLKSSPRPANGAIGFHTYLDELLRVVPFTSPRPNSKGAANGMRLGQKVDSCFGKLVAGTKVSRSKPAAMARQALNTLRKNNILVLRTQVRVSMGRINTFVDGVAMAKLPQSDLWTPMVVELKTSCQPLREHVRTYDLRCKRRPLLSVNGVELDNTEKNGHLLQTHFGAMALGKLPEFHRVKVRSVVIYSTPTGCRLYEVPPKGFPICVYQKGGTPRQRAQQSFQAFSRLPGPKNGGGGIRSALGGLGFKRIVAQNAGRCSFTASLSGRPVHGALVPTYATMQESQQIRTRTRLLQFAPEDSLAVIVHRAPHGQSAGWSFSALPRPPAASCH